MGLFLRNLVVISLCFAFILSAIAVPSSRSLKSVSERKSYAQDIMMRSPSSSGSGRMLLAGRMLLIDTNDYGGPSANKNHDPQTPGTK